MDPCLEEASSVERCWWRQTVLFFTGVACLLFWDGLVLGRVPVLRDILSHYHPWRVLAVSMIKAGHAPFWDPYSFCGIPLFANPQLACLYPPNSLFLVLPFGPALMGYLIGHVVLAGVGVGFLLRRLQVDTADAWAGGVAFCLGGWVMGRIEFLPALAVGVWTPVALGLVHCGTRRAWALLCLVLALQVLAGDPQTLAMSWMVTLFWSLWMVSCRFRSLGRTVAAMLLGCMISGVQLLPSLVFAMGSSRAAPMSETEAFYGSLSLAELIRFLWPFRFGGASAGSYVGEVGQFWLGSGYFGAGSVGLLLLLAFGCMKKDRRDPISSGLLILFAGSAGLACFVHWPLIPDMVSHVPGVLNFRWPARWLYLSNLAGAIGLGWACHRLQRAGKKPAPSSLRIASGVALVLLILLGMKSSWAQRMLSLSHTRDLVRLTLIQGMSWDAWRGLGLLLFVLLGWACQRRWSFRYSRILLAATCVDLFFFAWGLHPMGETRIYDAKVDPSRIPSARVFVTAPVQWWNNYLYGIRDPEIYEEARGMMMSNRHILAGARSAGGDNPLIPKAVDQLMRRLRSPDIGLEEKWGILADLNVSRVLGIELEGDAFFGEYAPLPAEPLRTGEQLGKRCVREVSGCRAHASFEGQEGKDLEVRWEINRYRIPLAGAGLGRVLFRESFDRGWKARVDGKPVSIDREGIFMSVSLEGPAQELVLDYRPPGLVGGTVMTVLGLVLVLGCVIVTRRTQEAFSSS